MTFDEPMSTSKCHTTLQMPNTVSNWLALKVFANLSAQLLTLDIDVDLESLNRPPTSLESVLAVSSLEEVEINCEDLYLKS